MKRRNKTETKNIYLAGKIEKNCWRHRIVNELREACYVADQEKKLEEWTTMEKVIFGKHNYVGPYFIGCDHGCFHVENSHGYGKDNLICSDSIVEAEERRNFVHGQCLSAIEKADVVFAYINSLDSFGTIWELGCAFIMGKEIVIACSEEFYEKNSDDLWFVLKGSTGIVINDNPQDALKEWLEKE